MILLDVRTKILLLFFANYLLFIRAKSIYEWSLVLMTFLLFCLAKQWKRGLTYTIIFSLLYVIDVYIWQYVMGDLSSFLSMLSIGFRMMLPCFMVGSYLLSTTRASQLIIGLRKWHVPEKVLLTFAVMFRFLPSIIFDYRLIQQSLKIRGIFLGLKDSVLHPINYFEYVTVPLIMSISRTAQDLTIAAMIKSVDKQTKKTIYHNSYLALIDKLVLLYIACHILLIHMF